MRAKENIQARRSTWRREFATLVKMAEKMKYEQRTEKGKGVTHARVCGRQKKNKSQKTEEGACLARLWKSNHSCS